MLAPRMGTLSVVPESDTKIRAATWEKRLSPRLRAQQALGIGRIICLESTEYVLKLNIAQLRENGRLVP